MQIVGFNFDKILAEKKKKVEGKVEVKSNIDLKLIEQEKIEMFKDKEVLKFTFDFSISFSPGIAELSFKGNVLLMFEKDKVKEILKKWKSKKLEDEIKIPLYNIILKKCNLRALQLEEEFMLPTHIQMPKIRTEDNKGYVQ